jgi:hypothetical protein
MNYELFRRLIDQFWNKEITREQLIKNWSLVQRYLGIAK